MKKLIIYLLLLALLGCAHPKPIATPEEVNEYLDRVAERSTIDFFDRIERSIAIPICPYTHRMAPPLHFGRLKIMGYT